jgi:ATP phosphoribosyltransferase regulatory subunit
VDPVEFRGLRYHTGVTLTVFAPGRPEELARGGRYISGGEGGEPATGLTLYPDAVLRAAPPRAPKPRIYVPAGTADARAEELRGRGYATVAGLEPGLDPEAEARRLGCDFLLTAAGPAALARE